MIVFDVARDSGVERVAVIGSCRLTGPMIRLQERGCAEWVWGDAAPAYTTALIDQNIRLVLDQPAIPAFIQSLIFPDGRYDQFPGDRARFLSSVDTFLVEIADLSLFQVGPWAIQVNGLIEDLVHKHPDALLRWWSELRRHGRATKAGTDEALRRLRKKDIADRDEFETVVRTITHAKQDEDQLRTALTELTRAFPARWIFVSHFIVPGDIDTRMSQRHEISEWLSSAAGEVGAEFFDPSEVVAKAGRERALDGADVHHYAAAFIDVVADVYLGILHGGGPPRPSERESAARNASACQVGRVSS